MSRQRCIPVRAKASLGLLLLAFAGSISACDEDGKTAPERCADPGLPIFDIQSAGAPADDNRHLNSDPTKPCVTTVGHAVNLGVPDATGGTDSTASGGKSGSGGTATTDAGAGGAP